MKILRKVLNMAQASPATLVMMVGAPVAAIGLIYKFIPDRRTQIVAVVALGGVILLVLGVRYFFRWRAMSRAKAMYSALDAEHQRAVDTSATEERARVEEIRRRFQNAVHELQKAKRSIYDLPWFLLIGESQSGKSMTLRGSEMHFPVGTEELSGLGGTQNCDWWFTNQAVILDTAGRFTFQEAGAPDRAEWEGFLDLLAKRRRHCPINGVIVVIPTDALLNDSVEVRREKAKNIHAKLGELQRTMGVQFPVFVVITKCDLVLGFSEFFRSFGEVEAAQLVGWSNDAPFDQPFDEGRFEAAFKTVYQRMSHRRLEVIRQPTSMEERGLAYSFPEEFKALGPPLQQYLTAMFSSDIYHDPLFFRGFYFSSGMQEGDPIVKVGREVLSGGMVGGGQREFDPLGTLFPSRAFFCADFYKKKALRESGMVFRSAAEIRRGKVLKRWTLTGGGALVGLLLLLMIIGGIKVNRIVAKPMESAQRAFAITAGDQRDVEVPEEDVENLLKQLRQGADSLAQGGFWFHLMALGRGAPTEQLNALHDGLFMYRRLRPYTQQLEAKLTSAEAWESERPERFRDSLLEYVRWYVGDVPQAPGTEEGAGQAFDRLYGPISGSVPPELRRRFLELSNYRRLGRLALSEDPYAEEPGALHRAIRSAGGHFKTHFAGERGPELGPWWRIVHGCENATKRYEAMLNLAEELNAARTIEQYRHLLDTWKRLFVKGPTDAPSFSEAMAAIRKSLEEIQRLTPRGAGAATEDGTTVLTPPVLSDVQPHWLNYFGQRGSLASDSLFVMINESRQLPLPAKDSLSNSLDGVVTDLRQEAERVIRIVSEKNQVYRELYERAKVHEELVELAQVLARVDGRLPADRKPRLTGEIGTWAGALPQFTQTPQDAAKAHVGTIELKRFPRSVADLVRLAEAVEVAARRHEWYVETTHGQRILLTTPLELLGDPDRERESVDRVRTGFEGLEQRFLGTTLNRHLIGLERLQKRLDTCIRESCALLGLDTDLELPGEFLGEQDPARRLSRFGDHQFRVYAGRYFEAWCGAYRIGRLEGYRELTSATRWSEYHDLIVKPPPGRDLAAQVSLQMKGFTEGVLEVGDEPLSGDDQSDTFLIQQRDHHRRMLETVRAETPACGPKFRDIHGGWRLGTTPGRGAAASASGLIREVEIALHEFQNTVRAVGTLDERDPLTGTPLADLSAEKIKEKSRTLSEELVLLQLVNVADRGRYLLNRELDEQLRRVIPEMVREPRGHAPFPFTRQHDALDPQQFPKDRFEDFLTSMGRYRERFGAISELTAKRYSRTEEAVGRAEYLDRVIQWRRFLYGGKDAEDDASRNYLSLRTPQPVIFSVQHHEPKDCASLGSDSYARATLSLGEVRGDVGTAVARERGQISFSLTRTMDPPEPAQRAWTFGQPFDAWLELSDPATGSSRPGRFRVDRCTLKDSVWSLPQFIYRFRPSDGFDRIQEMQAGVARARQRWSLQIDVDLPAHQGEPAVKRCAVFHIHIVSCGGQSCELPPPIGWFQPSTVEPRLAELAWK